MKRLLGWSALVIAVCLTAACSLWPAQPPLPQVHDFGPPPAKQYSDALPLRLDTVTALAWLESDAIRYRLVYNDPTALRTYADHRWVAPPAELLTARLQNLLPQQLTGDNGARGSYVLSANLLEFEQDFSAPRVAGVRLELEVSMRRARDGKIIATHRFVLTQSTTPNVQGAISGLAQLANQTALAIADWVQAQHVHE